MKNFCLALAAIALVGMMAVDANANAFFLGGGGRTVVRQVNRGPLGFVRNRNVVRVNNGGFNNVAVNVNGFNGFNRFNGFNNIRVNSFNRFGGFNNVAINSFGGFGSGFNRFGGFNNIAVVNGGLPVTTFNGLRVNAFGTSTVVDNFGNVFEADAFGNTAFRGNAGVRGFTNFGSAGFFPQAVGFGPQVISSGGFGFAGSCGF